MGDAGVDGFHVRPFRPDDTEALAELARGRLVIGLVPWRDAGRWAQAAEGWVRQYAAATPGPDRAVFVAEGGGRPLGFVDVYLRRHFTGNEEAYVGELVVAEDREGRGIGARLMAEAAAWARERGLPLIVLDTGARNERARAFYGRLGYAEESVMLAKRLTGQGPPLP